MERILFLIMSSICMILLFWGAIQIGKAEINYNVEILEITDVDNAMVKMKINDQYIDYYYENENVVQNSVIE